MKLLLLDTVDSVFVNRLSEKGITCEDGTQWSRDEALQKIAVYDAVQLRSRIKVDKEFIDKATRLKVLARAGAGLESIDVAYAESKGIKVLNSPEGNKDAVAEHALGMLLMLFNKLNRANDEVKSGEWQRERNRGVELMGKTVGVIGYGNMGSAFVQRLRGFGVRVLVYDKYKKGFASEGVEESRLEDIFEHADVLSLHVPLTEETEYLVDAEFLEKFKKAIYLLNTARGKILNTEALLNAINEGKVLGACLDVLEYEDHSFNKFDVKQLPEVFQELKKMENVVFSPHIAGWSKESWYKVADVLADKVLLALKV